MTADLGIIDNRHVKFIEKFKAFCKHTKELKIAAGYFYVSGFDLVKDDLKDISRIRVVMGTETDLETAQQIEQGYEARLKEVLIKDLQKITDQHGKKIEALKDLHDYIVSGKIEVRIYVEEKFHAKAYVFERKDESIPDVAIVGSSNFSRAGFGAQGTQGNTELNSIHKNDQDIAVLKNWYEQIWNEAKPFQKDLLHLIETSQPFIQFVLGDKEYVTPFELFKTMIFEFLDRDITAFKEVLAEFQKIGVLNAKQKINDFNGCIISDSVGLGKTLVGAGLIQDYQREGKNILLIVPASVKENWVRELTRKNKHGNRFFDVDMDEKRLKIITITELSRIDLTKDSNKQRLEFLKKSYSAILIDEAHRFRNSGRFDEQTNTYSGNKNYANIQVLRTSDKKYVLLTATPLNNSIKDLANLISLFTNPTILKNKDPKLEFSHFDEYAQTLKKIRNLENEGKQDSHVMGKLRYKLSEHLVGITRILEEVMILRTRTDINERYPDLIIDDKKITFKMAKIHPEKYEFPKTYLPIYENITEFLANLNVPHIALINETTGKILAGLYRILLFKRLESSIYSFFQSLERLKAKETDFLREIKHNGWEKTRQKRKSVGSVYNKEAVENDLELTEWIEEQSSTESSDEITQDQVIKMIEEDLEMIVTFYKKFIPMIKNEGKYSYDDAKLTKLKEILSNTSDQKVLVFTQYVDTVEYLYNNLKKYAESRNIMMDCVVGEATHEDVEYGTELPRERKIKLFAPIANDYQLDKGEKEINLLISTDALSEGVNLQDCNIVINYDLPWNPMRIVQRIGRVDRIGSEKRVCVYNIFPDKELDTLLDLIEKLNSKIANISAIIGKENFILSDDEQINPRIIGEKIKEIKQTSDYSTYESVGRNPLLKNIQGGEEKSAKRLELKSLIGKIGLEPSDFKEYDRTIYSIVPSETRKGLFTMFRIFDKSRKDLNGGKMEDIILYNDLKTTDIHFIDITELKLEATTVGIRKNDKSINYDLDKTLNDLIHYFEKTIFLERKSGFKKTKMRMNVKPTKLQKYVVNRLTSIVYNKKLTGHTSTSVKEQAAFLLREYQEKILDQKTSDMMKTNFVVNGSSHNVTTILENIAKFEDDDFVRKTNHFYENYMRDDPRYSKLRDERDIKYKIICWGALV